MAGEIDKLIEIKEDMERVIHEKRQARKIIKRYNKRIVELNAELGRLHEQWLFHSRERYSNSETRNRVIAIGSKSDDIQIKRSAASLNELYTETLSDDDFEKMANDLFLIEEATRKHRITFGYLLGKIGKLGLDR